jgi:hypothetical protein
MENYIVRIYRRDEQDPNNIVGTLESVEQQTRQSFKNMNALKRLLSSSPKPQPDKNDLSERSPQQLGSVIALNK